MRTKELIELLEKYPPKTRVYLADWIDGYNTPGEVTELEYENADYGFFQVKGIVLNAAHCGNSDD